MPRHFYVRAIYCTIGPCDGINHDGVPFTRSDIRKGTVLAIDKAGEWYIYQGGRTDAADTKGWPPSTEYGIKLFRDFWQCACKLPDASSPNDRAIINVPKRRLAGKQGEAPCEPRRRK